MYKLFSMNIIDSLQWRYAVKKFDDNKKLTEKQISILKEAFNLTATSYGLQPVSLVVIQNKNIQKQLVAHSFNQEQIAQASHVLVLCVPKTYNSEDIEKHFQLIKSIRNTPDDILNPFKKHLVSDITNKTDEQLLLWNKNQAYIALGNLLTVCAVEKIDACPMEGFIPNKYDEILGLNEKNLQSALVIPVGFRADDDYMKDLKKVRKDIKNSVLEIN